VPHRDQDDRDDMITIKDNRSQPVEVIRRRNEMTDDRTFRRLCRENQEDGQLETRPT